jgi:hypothetical protein
MRNWLLGMILVVAGMGMGCSQPAPPANAKTIKIVVQGPKGNKFQGNLQAASPGTAGMGNRAIEITAPGELEFKAGPSEYTLTMNGLSGCTYTMFMDGKQMNRGADMVVEDDKGPRITFTVPDK